MPWSTNTDHQNAQPSLSSDAKTKYNNWIRAIRGGKDPKTAAASWDSDYEVLKTITVSGKKVKLCSVRLTQGDRVYFAQNDSTMICEVRKVGSHTPPSGF